MFQSMGNAVLIQAASWLAQVPVNESVNTPEEAALVFSGPKFFVALIAGVVLAFALQLVLTNLSVAAGISYLGHKSEPDADSHQESGSLGGTIRKIGTAVGLWTLVTVSIALFIAALLAVKLSLIESAALGAIVGLVIWAAYFSLLVWVSSSTVGSLVGSVINTATAGFQSIVGTATAALGAKAASNQVVATAEAAAAAVRREFTSGFDTTNIRDTIEDYVERIKLPELDLNKIRADFERLLNDPELRDLATSGNLQSIDRQRFVELVSSRTDFSKRDINRIANQLETVWYQVLGRRQDPISEFRTFLASARPDQLRSRELSTRLDQLTEEIRQLKQTNHATQDQVEEKTPSLMQQAMQFGISTLTGTVLGRTDLSHLDVEKVLHQLQTVRDRLSDQAGKVGDNLKSARPPSTIRADIENYLLNSFPWHLNRETIRQEFPSVLYDPQADPGTVRRELESLDRTYFVDLLTQRGTFTQPRITEIADQLEAIRTEILSQVQGAETQEYQQDLRTRVETYLRNTGKEELNPEGIEREFRLLLDDPSAGAEALRQRLSHFDRDTLVQLLKQRNDLLPEEAAQALVALENTRDRVLSDAQSLQDQAKARAADAQQRVENYLRNTGREELNPDAIKRDLQILLKDPQTGVLLIRDRFSHMDRQTLVELLAQRPDIARGDAELIVSQVESVWNTIVHAPQILSGRAREQYDKTTSTIADYLRRTDREELSPEGIQRDLQTLLHDPKEGTIALRQRLSQVDRDTLVQLLSQQEGMSEERAHQLVDQTFDAIYTIIRAPRRFASRTQQRVQDFQTNLESYLRNTHKAELDPDSIKRDLQLLAQDPRAGLGSLSDRLSRVDRSTIVALLSQRQDMSEEEANRVVDQVLSVRDQMLAQVRMVQRKIQSVIDSIFARIRNYLNALERPELNYEGIRHDLRTLLHDPQAGFEALRDRLGSVNRETLVAIMSSREDISEADANRIIDQVEQARTSVLRRTERLQQQAQDRLAEVKYQARKQAEETRKAAASAAWWLFWTGVSSATCAAVAGALAVAG